MSDVEYYLKAWPLYWINLDRSEERARAMEETIVPMFATATRVHAVDGVTEVLDSEALEFVDEWRRLWDSRSETLTAANKPPGENPRLQTQKSNVAIKRSHQRALGFGIDQGVAGFFVGEDDIVPRSTLSEVPLPPGDAAHLGPDPGQGLLQLPGCRALPGVSGRGTAPAGRDIVPPHVVGSLLGLRAPGAGDLPPASERVRTGRRVRPQRQDPEAGGDPMSDELLSEIFFEQTDLQKMYGFDPKKMTTESAIEYIRWNSVALMSELGEMMGEVGWKPWATSKHINRAAFVGEGVDALKFLLNMLLAVGVTPEELHRKFMDKSLVNRIRQEAGYDGVTGKCDHCGRAQDEPHKAGVA